MKPEDQLLLHIGVNAKIIRTAEQLSLNEAAALCHMNKTAISRIE